MAAILVVLIPPPVNRAFAEPPDSIIIQRNLFSDTRTAGTFESEDENGNMPGEKAAENPLPPGSVQLEGVIMTGESRRALLRVNPGLLASERVRSRNQNVSMVWAKEEDSLGEYKIARINRESVIMQKGDSKYEIGLFAAGKITLPPLEVEEPPAETAPDQAQEPAPEQGKEGASGGESNAMAADANASAPGQANDTVEQQQREQEHQQQQEQQEQEYQQQQEQQQPEAPGNADTAGEAPSPDQQPAQ